MNEHPQEWLDSLPPLIGPNGTAWNPVVLNMGGWNDIVRRLVDDLIEMGWDLQLMQIKEKYGGLRFYISSATDEIFDRIEEAESESLRTCCDCGAPGKTRDGGWIMTLCDEHAAKEEKRKIMMWVPAGRPGTQDKWGNECGWPTEPGEYEWLEDMYYDDWKNGDSSEEEMSDQSTDVFEVEVVPKHGLMASWMFCDDSSLHSVDDLEYGYWRRHEL